jgi:hypothetical protein
MTQVYLHVARRVQKKNHTPKYQLVAKENYEYSVSTHTSRQYVRRRNTLEAGSAFALRRSHRATGGILNWLDLDSTKSTNNVSNEYKEEEEKEKEKRQEMNHQEDNYDHSHEKRSYLKNITSTTKDGAAVQKSSTLLSQ